MAKLSKPPSPREPRVTRSMSQEPSLDPAGQRDVRSRENTSTPKKKRAKTNQNALPTVDEDDIISEPDQGMVEEEPMPEPTPDLRSSQALSMAALSRTTARTGWSATSVDDLDPDLMVDRLQRVSSAADDLMNFLLPADSSARGDVLRQILVPNSTKNKIFVSRVTSLVNDKGVYGDQEYVNPNDVLQTVLGTSETSDVPAGPWRPDDIIYKVNLAQMLRRLLITHADPGCDMQDGLYLGHGPQTQRDILFQLDAHFASAVATPGFNLGATRLGLDITVQNCIARLEDTLEDNPDLSPISVIDDVCLEDGYYRHAEALHLHEMDDEAQESYDRHIRSTVAKLRAPFEKRGASLEEGIATLKNVFPWNAFMRGVMFYYDSRRKSLDRRIAAAGGVSQIARLLSEELQRRTQQRVAKRRRDASAAASTTTAATTFPGSQLAKLKMRSARLSTNTPEKAAQTPGLDAAVVAGPSKAAGKQRQLTQSPARSLTERQQDFARSRPGSSNKVPTPRAKIRSLMDPHPNAERVDFGTGFSQDEDDEEDVAPPVQSPNKRTYAAMVEDDDDEEFEPTQDQGFQTDTRDVAAANARRNAAPQPYRPTFQLVPTAGSAQASEGRTTGAQSRRTTTTEERRNPGSALPPPTQSLAVNDPELPASSFFQQAKLASRAQTISRNAEKAPQTRNPWSTEEENTLMDLVKDHGVSWSQLKGIDAEGGNVLRFRTPEDIRWKARNMKFTLLKSGFHWPAAYGNWDLVKLSKREIDALHKHGVVYAQERVRGRGEEDLDE